MIIKLMLDLGTFNYPNNYYLFGPKFMPSEEWIIARKWLKKHIKVKFMT